MTDESKRVVDDGMAKDESKAGTSGSSFIPHPSSFEVTFVTEGQERTLQVAETEYLLDAANNAGLNLPFSCLQGWCTTCAGKVLEGKVDQLEALRVYRADEEAGLVLLCSAYPRSNLRILTHQKEAMRAFRRAHGLPAPRG